MVGMDPIPTMTLSIRVGGPLATTRAEAASLLQLIRDVGRSRVTSFNLLVFVDCLVVLDILTKWGRCDYYPRPKEIVHFNVIYQLLVELRRWPGQVRLVKVKSHSGCLLNERADEEAERGRTGSQPEICPGPQKYGALLLRIRQSTRALAEACGQQLPRDSAPNVSLIKKVILVNTLRAVQKRSTVFVKDLLHRMDGATVSSIVKRCGPAEYRVWLRCKMGIYPIQTYLHRVGLAPTQFCPHCMTASPETLAHFACVCPQFREALTSAHNQVSKAITSFLTPLVGPQWKIYEESPMSRMGLILRPVSVVRAAQSLDQNPDPGDSLETMRDLGRWQPDWVFVSAQYKRIALVDLCRSANGLSNQLTAAGSRKQLKFSPLVEALSHYLDNGWVVHVFPWVVGIRGLIDPRHINALLEFLAIHKRHWQTAAEKTVLASVRALYFMHQVRFGGSQHRQLAGQMWCSSDSSGEDDDDLDELVAQATRKRKPVTASVRT